MRKTINISEDTIPLLNSAKQKILRENPQQTKVSDDEAVATALKEYAA